MWRLQGAGHMTLGLNEAELRFLNDHYHAAMITLRASGTPHVAQVGIALVTGPDGVQHLWQVARRSGSGPGTCATTPAARCSSSIRPCAGWDWRRRSRSSMAPTPRGLHPLLFRAVLGLGPEQNITWGDNEATDAQIVAMTAAEERLIYDFDIHKTYGRLTT